MRRGVVCLLWLCLAVVGLLRLSDAADGDGEPAAESAFPMTGWMPKVETGALRFLEQHPESDGRGVIVAVLDSGVDPGAPGLEATSTGEDKVIALIDATGSGDVVMGEPTAVVDGHLDGLSGRKLRIDERWVNPTGEYRLGLKAAFELFPGPLVDRLKEDRREEWEIRQREAERALRDALEARRAEPGERSRREKREIEDLEVQLRELESMGKAFEDPGPVFDCVVFHDGERWRAVIDTDEDGDLGNESVLTDFATERRFGTFPEPTLLNYAVNIYEGGRTLSIVVDSGMHGSHVAGIIAGFHPEQPELNGVAPGAQIVSIKIGDTRLGGMETGQGVARAAAAIREFECDLANMSYGEPTLRPNHGPLIRRLAELVEDQGVVFVASAGNEGPALSTVGAPGGTTSAILGVGAAITPELRRSAYAMREAFPAGLFTFSSRGPATDGAWGVDLAAPGGAVSSVSRWNLRRGQLAHGTSMASPSACGAIALVLSGAKAAGMVLDPVTVARAARNTAAPLGGVDRFSQGAGMIQVDRMFALLEAAGEAWSELPRLEVAVPSAFGGRGIYLRGGGLAVRRHEVPVSVRPAFSEWEEESRLADFEARLVVRSDAPWVRVPDALYLTNRAARFSVGVDPVDLPPGVHVAEVVGLLAGAESLGPVFRVPVTVARVARPALDARHDWEGAFALDVGEVDRRFLEVPEGAAWMDIEVGARDREPRARRLTVHVASVEPGSTLPVRVWKRTFALDGTSDSSARVPVRPREVLEVCFANEWTSPAAGRFAATARFGGARVEGGVPVLTESSAGTEVRIVAGPREVELKPEARLTALERTLHPSKAVVRRLDDERDFLEDARAFHELVLEYEFDVDRRSTAVTPRFPGLNGRLYEAEFDAQLWMIFDARRRRVAVDDMEPGSVSLEKGRHTLRLHLRHEDRDLLDKLVELPAILDTRLDKPVAVTVHEWPDDALLDRNAAGNVRLGAGRRTVVFLDVPEPSALPDGVAPGDVLTGTLTLEEGTGADPAPIAFVPDAHGARDAGSRKPDLAGKSFAEAGRAAVVGLLAGFREIGNLEAFDEAVTWLLDTPDVLDPDSRAEVLREILRRAQLDGDLGVDGDAARAAAVVSAADALLEGIDENRLARYFGRRHPSDSDEARERKVRMERDRDTLVEALTAKAIALAGIDDDDEGEGESESDKDLDRTLARLRRWADLDSDDRFAEFREALALCHGLAGKLLGEFNRRVKDGERDRALDRKRIAVLRELGWDHLAEAEERWLLRRYPKEFAPF